jgi:predicted SnoaL-like aldol condensation-catalyzing enzyme
MAARKKKKAAPKRPVRKVAKKAVRNSTRKAASRPSRKPAPKPARRSVAKPTLESEKARLERNKKLVVAFYQKMIGEKDPDAARRYMGEDYKQHSAYARDGFEGVAEFARHFKASFPNHHYDVKKVIAEGDLVVLHLHGQSGMFPNGEQVVDIFRVVDGKVVEHWDVIQEIPATASNPNGTF